jgi:hypothetical protein
MMAILLIGIALLACIVGLFLAKNTIRRPWLARLAYSEFTMRLTVLAGALILVGVIATLGKLLG